MTSTGQRERLRLPARVAPVALAALACACVVGRPPPSVAERQAEPAWGPTTNGLRMRVRAPQRAACGDAIEVGVELEVQREELPPAMRTIDARGPWYFARLQLSPTTGGEACTVRCEDPTGGMPDPPAPPDEPGLRSGAGYLVLDLQDAAPNGGSVRFPLSAVWDSVQAGSYVGVVELDFGEPHSHDAQGDWRGVVRSAPFPLRIDTAPVIFQEVEVPTGAGGNATVTLRLRVRNGFTLGLHGEGGSRGESTLLAGSPGDEFAEQVRRLVVPGSGAWEIFETSEAPAHLWMPGPGSDNYLLLWRGTTD